MSSNKEKLCLYYVYLMSFGILVLGFHLEFFKKIFFENKINDGEAILISVFLGGGLVLLYCLLFGIINSWVLNIVYILRLRKKGWKFLSYNIFPFIYTRENKKKVKMSFNILLLFDIGSIISSKGKIKNHEDVRKYIKTLKQAYKSLVYANYIMIAFGVLVLIVNVHFGGMIIIFTLSIILFGSISNDLYFGSGYVYLSKNFSEENILYTLITTIKIQEEDMDYIYEYIQEYILNNNLENMIVDEIYGGILINSINNGEKYLNEKNEKIIIEEFKQRVYLDSFCFLEHYRLYRLYSLYVLNFYGKRKYDLLIKDMEIFFEETKDMPVVGKSKMFKIEREILNNYTFEKLKLKNNFDICNSFEQYNKKLKTVKANSIRASI